MSYAMSSSLVPTPPPGEDELPYSDGEPMDSERHRRQQALLTGSLELAWRDRDDVYVGGNMFVYFSETQVKKNDFRGPDVFIVLDTIRRERKSWVVWQEQGRTPDVVIELISESTEKVDRGDKMRIYAQLLHVPHYYLFDPLTGVLEGYALDVTKGRYMPMQPGPGGELPSPRLGLRLGVRRSIHQGIEADWLRWIDESGRALPTPEEQARAAEEQARAAEEQARAAKEQAKSLAARIEAYERRFGLLPPEEKA